MIDVIREFVQKFINPEWIEQGIALLERAQLFLVQVIEWLKVAYEWLVGGAMKFFG